MEIKKLLIDGVWMDGEPGVERLFSTNPATGAVNHEVAAAGAQFAAQAVASAHQACRQPGWRDMLPAERARILYRIAEGLEAHRDEMSRLQMLENGKVWKECQAQVKSAAATFRYYAGVCETLGSEVTPARGNYLSLAIYEPYGVVVAITPWNSPMTMEAQKIAPALAAGNAVILKPSEVTPSTGLLLGKIALDAGLPAGILNVLPGWGHEVGAALVAHPQMRLVSFTGGTESGRRIAQVAASKLMPVALELGGKSPHIVFDDADLDLAVDSIAGGIFEGSGQSCVAGSRAFVQRGVYDQVLRKLVERARAISVDLPDQAHAQMGPMASFAHRDKVASMVDQAIAAGAKAECGARAPEDQALAAGAFYLPTILTGMRNSDAIAQQEIFGPVLCLMPFDGEADLVEQANASVFGLASGIWTGSYQRAWRVARALEAGTVWINTYKQLSIATPFGGFKDSGIGREKGIQGVRLYQQAKGIFFGM